MWPAWPEQLRRPHVDDMLRVWCAEDRLEGGAGGGGDDATRAPPRAPRHMWHALHHSSLSRSLILCQHCSNLMAPRGDPSCGQSFFGSTVCSKKYPRDCINLLGGWVCKDQSRTEGHGGHDLSRDITRHYADIMRTLRGIHVGQYAHYADLTRPYAGVTRTFRGNHAGLYAHYADVTRTLRGRYAL